MVSRNEVDNCDDNKQESSVYKSEDVKKVVVSVNSDDSDLEDSDMEEDTYATADTESVDSDEYDYANADTDSADSDFDYDFLANIDTAMADSDVEEVVLDKSPPLRRIRWKRVLLPRWTFVPPVFRDGHWVMPVQQCDANLCQMAV